MIFLLVVCAMAISFGGVVGSWQLVVVTGVMISKDSESGDGESLLGN